MRLKIYCDGLCEPVNPNGYGCCAFVVFEGEKIVHQQYGCIARPGDNVTNNIAEYRAVRAALLWVEKYHERTPVDIHTDSMLVVEQSNGRWDCHAERLIPLRNECQDLLRDLPVARLLWIPRKENEVADRLTRIAYDEARRKAKVA